MTDRELLELAAKAAGWKGWRSKHGYWNVEEPGGQKHVCCNGWPAFDSSTGEKLPEPTFGDAIMESNWNPLTDDGDALRLAVKLHLEVAIHETYSGVINGNLIGGHEQHGTDPYAATRRAIVRAAAKIGKEMK